ncbi:MAG: hypothetical protein ICV68_16425 [Pyrinomonadaceae bacterium]|nr:hypothetical protein [Pyrinomonadaceae bacterium]
MAYHLALILERLPIEKTTRTLHTLIEKGIVAEGLVVDRVLPDVVEGDFMRARLE